MFPVGDLDGDGSTELVAWETTGTRILSGAAALAETAETLATSTEVELPAGLGCDLTRDGIDELKGTFDDVVLDPVALVRGDAGGGVLGTAPGAACLQSRFLRVVTREFGRRVLAALRHEAWRGARASGSPLDASRA